MIEPWTKIKCSVCGVAYHLIDGAPCICGKKESNDLMKKHIGDMKWEQK